MFKRKSTWTLLFLAAAIVTWLAWDLIKTGNPQNLPGGFKEVATYRNQNNTGPVQLVYIVTVADTLNAQYENYGNMMPHIKYGLTKVYFFPENKPYPTQLGPGQKNFNERFNADCIALFEKFAMGNKALTKRPFK
ncbi:MAG: hypothetical protein EOO99_10375 [Pedobacter sp.]|nr:MAG: hypothetical protein EOO99_10375 [Pedobacter sp.]